MNLISEFIQWDCAMINLAATDLHIK